MSKTTRVTELGYLGFSVKDAAAWKRYAGELVGMQVVDEGESDRFYLRMDNWHHRMTVHITSGDEDLEYLGWRVAGPEDLEAMARQLTEGGVKFRVGTEAENAERHVMGLLKMTDPGGIPTEIFYGPRVDTGKPFHPGRPMYGRFVTVNAGLGHCILRQDDDAAAYKFYSLLGLQGSVEYQLRLPNGMIAKPTFMHCNERQHSIAFGLGPMPRRINHLMLEYTELDDLGIAHDLIRKAKIDVALQLGKHSNDQALTFYSANPSGWAWELGWGARKALAQQEYYVGDIFGHGVEATGYGLDLDL
ncbi:MAG: VOC family protein [Panacagrimonas sp.]